MRTKIEISDWCIKYHFSLINEPILAITSLAISEQKLDSLPSPETLPEPFRKYLLIEDQKILKRLEIPIEKLVLGRQVHSKNVMYVSEAGLYPETDGFFTDRKNLFLGIRTADCAAVMVVFPDIPAIGIVHAGWKGARAGIVRHLLQNMLARWQVEPDTIQIAVSPFIKKCCYEVGPEFDTYFDREHITLKSNKRYLDLETFLFQTLKETGISRDQITFAPFCTACSELPLYSYRKTKTTRRMFTIIQIEEEQK